MTNCRALMHHSQLSRINAQQVVISVQRKSRWIAHSWLTLQLGWWILSVTCQVGKGSFWENFWGNSNYSTVLLKEMNFWGLLRMIFRLVHHYSDSMPKRSSRKAGFCRTLIMAVSDYHISNESAYLHLFIFQAHHVLQRGEILSHACVSTLSSIKSDL